MKQTQCERLRDYLIARGSVTPMEAWSILGIYRLAARIHDLKRAGHPISSGQTTVANAWGEKFRVSRYTYQLGELQ